MAKSFTLSCESTVDMPFSYIDGRGIPVLFYSYSVDGTAYADDMGRDPQALPDFYRMLAEGALPATSQLNEYQYEEFFRGLLEKGDVLHVCLGSGMTKSVDNAFAAAEALQGEYPHRKLTVIDSLCSSSGYGMLVDYLADMRDEGCSLEAAEQWATANRHLVHHQFYSTDLSFFRRSGRVSGPAATIGNILNICPVMRLDDKGAIIAYAKVRGKKNALRTTIDAMAQHAQGGEGYSGKCYICHSDSLEDALATKEAVTARFSHIQGDIRIFDIGTIIASHAGPGTVAVFFMGDARKPIK